MQFLKLFPILILTMIFVSGCGSGNKSRQGNIKSPEEILEEGDAEFQAGLYKEALQTYQTLLALHPTSDLHVDTQLRMAETYGKMDKFEEQMGLLKRILQENIIPGYVPQIYIQIGKFYERAAKFNPGVITSDTTDLNTAIKYYERAQRYEDSEDSTAKAEAVYRKGLVEAKLGKIDKAVLYYEIAANQYEDTPFALLAKVKLRNPRDTAELLMDPASMEEYVELIGSPPSSSEQMERPMIEESTDTSEPGQSPANEQVETANPVEAPAIEEASKIEQNEEEGAQQEQLQENEPGMEEAEPDSTMPADTTNVNLMLPDTLNNGN